MLSTSNSDKDRLLFIPGPTPVCREILEALSAPTISHTSAEFARIFKRTLGMLLTIMGNEGGLAFLFAGSGTLAQEASIVNFVEPGQTLLVASNGYFGDRLSEIGRAHGIEVVTLQAAWGESIEAEQIEQVLRAHPISAVALTHVETSTGAMAPLKEILSVIKGSGALSIVDGVAAFGGIAEPMSELGIDVLLSGAQKALGVPPGLSIIGVTEAAWKRRESRASAVPGYYVDLARWLPVMEQPDRYFSTHPVNHIYALERALDIVVNEGLPNRFKRHEDLAGRFRQGMLETGFELFTDENYLAPTLSVLRTPNGVRSSEFRSRLTCLGVVAAGGLADSEDRVVRFGHMGNISGAEVAAALDASERSLAGKSH